MAKKSIPDRVKAQVATIIEQFNQEIGQQYMAKYVPRYRGNYLYLDRVDFMGNQGQICRLTYLIGRSLSNPCSDKFLDV